MKVIASLLLIAVLLAACAPSQSAVQTAIAQTAAAAPTSTPQPTATSTPEPTETPTPAPTTDPCYASFETYYLRAFPIYTRWTDTYKIAIATSRIALGPQISAMQSARHELESLYVPQCAKKDHANMLDAFDRTEKGMLSFMSGYDLPPSVEAGFRQSYFAAEAWNDLYQRNYMTATPTP